MNKIAIIADDLTGALDAAAPFAARGPVEVSIRRGPAAFLRAFVVDTETRDMVPDAANAVLREMLPLLRNGDIRLKKVDSLLRGNTFREIATCWSSGLFGSMVIAPAFPAEGRITRAGNQIVVGAGRLDIAANLAERNLRVHSVARGAEARGEGAFLCDAETDADLAAIAMFDALTPPVLWCGSAGLARALAGESTHIDLTGARRLAIVGSRHPATLRQVEQLRRRDPAIVTSIATVKDIGPALDHIAENIKAESRAALLFEISGEAPAEAAGLQLQTFERLPTIVWPDLVAVTGGETLVRLLDATRSRRVAVTGEWQPGIAVAELGDGLWQGATVIGKSGGFGTPDVMVRLLQ